MYKSKGFEDILIALMCSTCFHNKTHIKSHLNSLIRKSSSLFEYEKQTGVTKYLYL